MTPERWQIVEELYHSALDLSEAQRQSFLNEECADDQSLLYEVESLLEHGFNSQSVLDTPAIALIAKAVAADEYELPGLLLDGTVVSHYRILGVLGHGGMGVVYKAEDITLRRLVALKFLPQLVARDPLALQRFQLEAQAASALNHPNICTVYEIGETEGLHFIAIELLDGETLKDRIARGGVSTEEILSVGGQLCEALDAAHNAGVIHRDIKPSNIALTTRGTKKLLDFGVAKRVGQEPTYQTRTLSELLPARLDLRLTTPGMAVGTIAYMSPEQARGEEVDARSDLFSLGTVLYEMATRKCPFSGRNPADVFEALQERQPPQIGKINPAIPSELIKITSKALQKDRALRYQTAADMRSDLQELTASLQRRAKRWKAWSVVLAVAVISVALLIASLRFTRLRRWVLGEPSPAMTLSEIKSLAVLPLENLTGDPTQEYFTDGMTDALITNLTKLGSLRVISRTSAMHYKGTHPQLADVARTLGVGAVMEGSMVRSGDRVRVSVQLVDAANDRNIWARDYERDMRDVLQLQNEVASMVAQALAGTLNVQEKARLAQTQTVRPEVYEAYLKGRYFSNRPNEDGIKKGIVFFQDAIRLDPNYAPAYAGLADAYAGLSFAGVETDRPKQLAIEAAKKAISLDDSLAEAHASLGWILHRHMQNWSEAEKEYRRAIELNPNYAMVHRFYGHFLRAVGEDELACNENQLAHELDPLNTLNTNAWAQCVYETGHFAEAIRMVQDILEIDPDNLQSRWTLGEIYERHGMFPQAIAQYEKGREITHGQGFIPYSLLGSAYAGSGQADKAEKILREMNHKFGEDKWISASIHVRIGRKEQAIRELTDDNAKCGPGTCGPAASLYIWNWRFSPLYPDPRFQALLEKFHYPESAFRKIRRPSP